MVVVVVEMSTEMEEKRRKWGRNALGHPSSPRLTKEAQASAHLLEAYSVHNGRRKEEEEDNDQEEKGKQRRLRPPTDRDGKMTRTT